MACKPFLSVQLSVSIEKKILGAKARTPENLLVLRTSSTSKLFSESSSASFAQPPTFKCVPGSTNIKHPS